MSSVTKPMRPPAQDAAEPSAAKGLLDALRLELLGEAADLATPFLIGVRGAARAGEVARVSEGLKAVALVVTTMRRAYREIAQSGDDPRRGA